jgi:hypothetical protein
VLVSTEPAVVRIVNLEEEKAKARDREVRSKISRRLAVEDKELQVGWTAAPPDLAHKLATAQATLAKGDRVHMVFAMRANSSGGARTYVANETKLAIVAQFDAGLKDLGKRWKPDEIANGLWVCYWQPLDTVNADARTKLQDAMSEKRKDKDDKKEARKLKEAERQRKAAERRAAEK